MHRISICFYQIGKMMLGAALLTSVLSPAEAVVIDFDTLPNGTALLSGTAITTQYQPLGAVFASNGGASAHVLNDPPEAVSQPNVLVGNDVFSDLFLRFVDPTTGSPSTANNVSVYAISVGHAQWTVTAKDALGQTLQNFVLQNLSGPVNGLGNQDLLTFTATGIATIDFVFTIVDGSDGIGIDNLSFTVQQASAVPEPGTVVLLGTGLAGLLGSGWWRRRWGGRVDRVVA